VIEALDRRIAWLLFVAAAAILFVAAGSEGVTRDEGYYFDAGETYWQWYAEIGEGIAVGKPLEAFHKNSVDRYWGYNHEHPPLMKVLYGVSWRLLHRCDCPNQAGRHPVPYKDRHRTLGLLSELEAFRLPAVLFGGLLVALVYLFGVQAVSRRAGLCAAALALLVPRYFFHAELSCFDAPMATTWLLTIYCYWRSLEDPRYALYTGVAFGLALATKHNAFFLPLPILLHYLWVRRDALAQLRLPPIPPALVWMALLGPAIDFALWPWMWFSPIERIREYFAFHLQHVHYNFEYLGVNYNNPPYPRSYPFVMTLLTVPVTTLALSAVGAISFAIGKQLVERVEERVVALAQKKLPPPPPVYVWRPAPVGTAIRPPEARPGFGAPARGYPNAAGLLFVLNAFIPPAIIAFTGAPIFGETKHWLAAMPFIALLAGAGAEAMCGLLAYSLRLSPRQAQLGGVGFALLLCAPAALETWRSHPYALTHYNLLAGGPRGGADLGLNRQFWGYASRGVLPWLNAHAHKNANVYWHDANQSMLNMDIREHLLRPDLMNSGMEENGVRGSSIGLVIHEKHFAKYDYWFWDAYGTTRPAFVLTDEGVPIVTVYQRPSP
jgi:4-amino-4-deoxy-L-arabinose transferase-like glycosyltransferase